MANGWPLIPLGDVLTERREIPSFENIETGEIGIVSKIGFDKGIIELRNETNTKTDMILICPGDLVISGINAVKGAIAIYNASEQKPIAATIHYGSYIPNQERVDIKFLWWFLRSAVFRDMVQEYIPGGIKTELKAKRFLSVPVPLPSLSEQRRIVSRIEALAGRLAAAQSLRKDANEEANKVFGSITYKLFTELAKTFKPISVGKIFTYRNELIRPTDRKSGEIRFIGLQHIESNTGIRIGEDRLFREILQGRKFIFSPGDIVYGYLRPYLNKVWIADCEGVCSVDQYVIQPKNEIVNTEFLAYFMRSPSFLDKAIELTHSLLLPRLRTGFLNSIQIPVPPLEEQRRLVAYLDGLQAQVSQLRLHQEETRQALDALLPSILDKAFKGEL